jgi:hypothetical protein
MSRHISGTVNLYRGVMFAAESEKPISLLSNTEDVISKMIAFTRELLAAIQSLKCSQLLDLV